MANFVDEKLYKRIKSLSRDELEQYIQMTINMGFEAAVDAIDFDELRGNIGDIHGVDDEMLDEIMTVIQSYCDAVFYGHEE